ncbi:MAG TPA: acyltransferase [Bradyrhizobium sp.]|nr:acyltransferase [Bradyrhizobium sp.]
MSDQVNRRPRLVNLQILRAVAAVVVVWAHGIDISLIGGSEKPLLAYGNLANFGAFGVDLFFVLSGYIITLSSERNDRNWFQFATDRFIRIAPIFYILSLPWIIRAMLTTDHSWRPFMPTFFFWPIIDEKFVEPFLSVGWTLSFEVLFYAAMTAAIVFRPWGGRPAVLVVAFFLAAISARSMFDSAVFDFLGNPIIIEFLFGIGISMLMRVTGPSRRLAVGASTLVVTAIVCQLIFGFGDISEAQLIQNGDLSLKRAIIWGLPAAGIVYATLLFGNPSSQGLLRRFLAFLGDASYSIYLVHLLVLAVFKVLQARGFVSGDSLIILSILCSLAAGSLSYLFIEKPTIDYLKRLLREPRYDGVRLPKDMSLS